MRLAIILFMLLNPTLQPGNPKIGGLDRRMLIEQDATMVAHDYRKYLVESKLSDWIPVNTIGNRKWHPMVEEPVIRNHPFIWDHQSLPMEQNTTKERSYAVLPNNFSLPDAKRRLIEPILNRTGRKENELVYSGA